jgi:signal transduction histidine kinase
VDPRAEYRRELEALALRRLPLAMAVFMLFVAGALPIELYYFPAHLRPYLAVYAVEALACAAAWIAARRWRSRTQAIATAWTCAAGLCVAAYYPLVGRDATLAMAALTCLVAAMPALLPLGVRHQATLGAVCALALFAVVVSGVPSSLPWPYVAIAFLSVTLLTSLGAHSVARFRWEAFQRQAALEQTHEHLHTALARAESAAEMRSRLVANVSHELRTPLNVIIGYTDMLLDAGADVAKVADTARRIRDYAVSLEALVSELLDLSRLAYGKVEVALAEIEIPPLLAEVAQGTRQLLRGKPVEVAVEGAVAWCHSDRLRLRQILNNLATNAAKFTAEGAITIAARAERDRLVLQVRDTGCGIPPEAHERIFAVFEQAAPPGRGPGGMGLGLAIVRQLTDLLGGTVAVASTPGAGAVFTVTLPGAVTPIAARDTEPAPGRETDRSHRAG